MKLRLSKGTKDYLPDEQIVRNQIKDMLRSVFERYGYSPIETPVLELKEILASKYAGGAEILKEMFTLQDQGDRDLALRYDLTVPLARVIGMNPALKMPFKRYEMGRVFRDGPIKLGRLREFWQCDIDIVGSSDLYYDAELIALAIDGLKALDLSAYIEINNRKILTGIMEDVNVPEKFRNSAILSVDKLKKVGMLGVKKELVEKKIDVDFDILFKFLNFKGSNNKILSDLKNLLKSKTGLLGVEEMEILLAKFEKFNMKADVRFTPSLARGLDYYTGMIFEGFVKDSVMTSSICGGGRWDNMVGKLVGKDLSPPAVGFTFGLDAIFSAISKNERSSVVDVWLCPIKAFDESIEILSELRNNKIRADIDAKQRGISKNLDYANKLGIPFVLILGSEELSTNKLRLKDMATGDESLLSLKDLIKRLSKSF